MCDALWTEDLTALREVYEYTTLILTILAALPIVDLSLLAEPVVKAKQCPAAVARSRP